MIQFRRFIERERAPGYLFMMLLSFAATVLLTRIFLALTGYPQLGNEQLHIAHVLWGGLILGVGAALPLVYTSRFIYGISALLNGIGLGLFLDEVGKFLTQNNDYFFRPAASIIYIIFLLVLYLYLIVRRGEHDAQTRLHHVLGGMQEIVDGDLDEREKAELEAKLVRITQDRSAGQLHNLAEMLLDFVQNEADTIPHQQHWLPATWERGRRWLGEHILTRQVTRWLVILSTLFLAALALLDFISLVRVFSLTRDAGPLIEEWITQGNLASEQEALWFAMMLGLKGVVGVSLVLALAMFATGNDQRGVTFAVAGLLLSITLLDVLLFYFEQFVAAAYVLGDFTLIGALEFYSNRYLFEAAEPVKVVQPHPEQTENA